MERLHTSTVTQDQIDHLGHMNVRFYTVLACAGAGELAARLGVGAGEATRTWVRDIYVRHHREQLVGAPLEVRGGVLDARPDRLRVYEELANADTGVLAATFVLGLAAVAGEDRSPASLSAEDMECARARSVGIPEHGRSRSISFEDDPAAGAPTLEELLARDLARQEARVVQADECDEDGWYPSDTMMALVWRGTPLAGREHQPFHQTPDGRTMGWATMETRAFWSRLPRVGDRVQSFAAELGVGAKTTTTRHWVYDLDRAELVGGFTVVNLAFDVEARRGIEIPEELRETLRARLQPDLA
ncbi:MAG: thioesterase family protein [Acidimicrobiia bacterium]|nr:thioesterase family protein [Acidimicrobiia bacterium]